MPFSTSWSTIFSPSPSIFIACRPAKCSRDSLRFAGHAAFTQRYATSSGSLNAAAAFRAFLRHSNRPPLLPFLDDFHDVRNHFARAFDDNRVADVQAEPLDF